MRTVYVNEELPPDTECSIFLAGPTPRAGSRYVPSWRPHALVHLRDALVESGDKWNADEPAILIPEDRSGTFHGHYINQVEWETAALERATVIMFWIPRDMETMPGLTTNDEWGMWKSSGKCVLGYPLDAQKMKYQAWWAKRLGIPTEHQLCDVARAAVRHLWERS